MSNARTTADAVSIHGNSKVEPISAPLVASISVIAASISRMSSADATFPMQTPRIPVPMTSASSVRVLPVASPFTRTKIGFPVATKFGRECTVTSTASSLAASGTESSKSATNALASNRDAFASMSARLPGMKSGQSSRVCCCVV